MSSLIIKYDPLDGPSVPDGLAGVRACGIADGSYEPATSNALVIDNLRLLVKLEKMEPFTIHYNGTQILCDKFGSLSEYPDGFCDESEKTVMGIMGW